MPVNATVAIAARGAGDTNSTPSTCPSSAESGLVVVEHDIAGTVVATGGPA